MEKIEVTIKHANNSKQISMIFYVEDAKNAQTFFEVLVAPIADKKVVTRTLPNEDEKDRMKNLAGIK